MLAYISTSPSLQRDRVRIVEHAIPDLATTHRCQGGIAGNAEAPVSEHTIVISRGEQGVTNGNAILAPSAFDRIDGHASGLIPVRGVRPRLRSEALFVCAIPTGATPGEAHCWDPGKSDECTLRGRASSRQEARTVDTVRSHEH